MYAKRFFPVLRCLDPIHGDGLDQAVINARMAKEYGSDGIFLIGRGLSASSLCSIYHRVRREYPHLWIGINFLDLQEGQGIDRFQMVKKCEGLNGVWLNWTPPNGPVTLPGIEVFGRVALTYDRPTIIGNPLSVACETAVRHVKVAVVSEENPALPPNISKLAEARKYLEGRIPLAYAGGLSIQNNTEVLLPHVDIFMMEYDSLTSDAATLAEKIHQHHK